MNMTSRNQNLDDSSKRFSVLYGTTMLLLTMVFGFFAPLVHAQAPVSFVNDEGVNDVYTTLRTELVRSYFNQWNLPAAEYADTFVAEADEYGLDWRLLPAIAMIESTGFQHQCQKGPNGLGWGGCAITFESHHDAIATVAKNLAGENPATAHFYADKTFEEKLYAYNSVRPDYRQKINLVMNQIYSPKYGMDLLQKLTLAQR